MGLSDVDIILDNDIVTARPSLRPLGISNSFQPTEVGLPAAPAPHVQGRLKTSFEPGRVQISFITAELARSHARKNLKVNSEPSNGVLAFDGELVSCNTTVVSRCLQGRVYSY
jgi:hypothetical protein